MTSELLKTALEDKERLENNLSVIFSTKEKHPNLKSWQEHGKPDQTDEDIKKLYQKHKTRNTSYSYFTGINGLIDLDFDWEWTYHEALRRFGNRMKTKTLRTPNGGYRALFITDNPKDNLTFKERPPRVEIHGNKGHHVIVHGKGLDDNGNLGTYKLIVDQPIKTDDKIIADMTHFLEEINKQCDFLEYNCINSKLKKKNNELTQEQRTSIGAFFIANKIDMELAIDFFRCTDDFNPIITRDHLERLKDKEFKHPTCKKLQDNFHWKEKDCVGCIRKNSDDHNSQDLKTDEENEDEHLKIDLKYQTNHLRGYDDLARATRLYGDQYKVIFKALWYHLLSGHIRTSKLKLGQIKVDGRIAVLFPVKSGGGKGSLKRVIKQYSDLINKTYAEPTSLHAEQLIGKTIKIRKSEEYKQNMGYLADDFVIIDESYNLLTSNELHYTEARKYIRTALDPYPENTVTKRSIDIPRENRLEYEPLCLICMFIQPFNFEDDRLVIEGDVRRFIIPFVKMIGIDKTNVFKRRILDEYDDEESLMNFYKEINQLDSEYKYFKFTNDAKVKFIELDNDLRMRGLNYSEKIMYFTDHIEFVIQDLLLKFSAVQSFQHNTNLIQPEHVELAYMDLFEILDHTYQYVEAKIPGYMNYGEGWDGALLKDQDMLRWLENEGATSEEDTNISIQGYKERIMKIYEIKERQALNIMNKHLDNRWISKRKGGSISKIWVNLDTGNTGNHARNKNNVSILNKDNLNYYYILNKYEDYSLNYKYTVSDVASIASKKINDTSKTFTQTQQGDLNYATSPISANKNNTKQFDNGFK